jgi:hypothetical protein
MRLKNFVPSAVRFAPLICYRSNLPKNLAAGRLPND